MSCVLLSLFVQSFFALFSIWMLVLAFCHCSLSDHLEIAICGWLWLLLKIYAAGLFIDLSDFNWLWSAISIYVWPGCLSIGYKGPLVPIRPNVSLFIPYSWQRMALSGNCWLLASIINKISLNCFIMTISGYHWHYWLPIPTNSHC